MSNQEYLTPNPDFDWGMYEKGTTLSEAARKEQEAKYEETLNSLKVNEVVIGKVVEFVKNDKTIREVLVDVGYKSLGVVPYTEFRYNQDLKVGDEVAVKKTAPAHSCFLTVRLVSNVHGSVSTKLKKRTKLSSVSSRAAPRAV